MKRYAPLAIGTPSVTTYDGIFLRNNLSSKGTSPAAAPFNQCPDIIQSDTPIPAFAEELVTPTSLEQTYNTEPVLAAPNYYYVRGANGATKQVSGSVSLYWAPAQVFNFPVAWQNNPMTTSGGASSAPISAAPGHATVGSSAFVWTPPALTSSTYFNVIAQASGSATPVPVPVVGSWMDLGALLSENLGFGFRNQAMVDGTAACWIHRQVLSVPASFTASETLQVMVTASGMSGARVGFLCDQFTAAGELLELTPTTINGDGVFGTTLTLDPGYTANLVVQGWIPEGVTVAPGATLTLEFTYKPTGADEIAKAMELGLLDTQRNALVARVLGVSPQPVVAVATLNFTVAAPIRAAH